MSWLSRNLFSRKRTTSLPAEDESKFTALEDTVEPEEDLGPEPTDEEIDNIDALFARLSVGDVRRYEMRLQRHVERMRRQMRRVAGAHYPELIDAADSVASMRTAAASVSSHLHQLTTMLHSSSILASPVTRTDTSTSSASSSHVYAVAAQVKVLVDTPEQIWKALGQQRSLHAALLFLIAQEIHDRLHAQSQAADSSDVDPILAFPVIERQWTSVAPFGEQVAATAHAALAEPNAGIESCASAVCAIALLEDADAEMACTVFLARRGQTLEPMLERMADLDGSSDVAGLAVALCGLLDRVRQILHDYSALFGVPEHARRQFASRVLTTLASISADADLPTAPEAPSTRDAGFNARDAGSKRASRLGSVDARRKRKSSLAGLMLSVPVSPMTDSFTFDDVRSPAPPVSATAGNGVFMVAKYLPPAVAQFRPCLPRMVDSCVLSDSSSDICNETDTLNEADEDDLAGLSPLLSNPPALLRALSTRAQPGLERIAVHALKLWWPDIVSSVENACSRAIGHHMQGVADAARVSAEIRNSSQPWPTDAIVVHATPLYATVVEPLLAQRARTLQNAAIDHTLAQPDAFLRDASLRDVVAGALPWRALPDESRVTALRADVTAGLDVVPATARALGTNVGHALRVAWRDAEAWWQQMGGATVGAESAACAAYLDAGWAAMTQRLEQWAAMTCEQAMAAVAANEREALANELGLHGLEMPQAVMLCVKGAWTVRALADEAQELLSTKSLVSSGSLSHNGSLMRECWRRQPESKAAASRLLDIGRTLLTPWLAHLGSSAALAWAAQFSRLYFGIPQTLQQDTRATRRNMVQAWHVASQMPNVPGYDRYSALRRATVANIAATQQAVASAGVRQLAARLDMRVQAVCGLGLLVNADERQAGVCSALIRSLDAVAAAHADWAAECDRAQLAADLRFVLDQTGPSLSSKPLLAHAMHLNAWLQPAIG
ncbi:hypothetical protein GGH12_002161 [Coemansia sp. RSA 1822]|nr:hypothetical protein LPJ76_004216 [Coemansia sp. RSA 638]KAJ2542157.1 hypothetical protein GGF49_003109 [Coemansia sp. RSA 1853]KAJ2564184.1 hypothetical protein GGH12_002161 [Coemansia sp. RSA 1822]